MSKDQSPVLKDFIPNSGMIYHEDLPQYILCKPKLMPLKSVTLEKLEKMQKEADEKLKQQRLEQMNEQKGNNAP